MTGAHNHDHDPPHRWVIQIFSILAIAALAGADLIYSEVNVDRVVYLIIGGIAIGVRPETLPDLIGAVFRR